MRSLFWLTAIFVDKDDVVCWPAADTLFGQRGDRGWTPVRLGGKRLFVVVVDDDQDSASESTMEAEGRKRGIVGWVNRIAGEMKLGGISEGKQ